MVWGPTKPATTTKIKDSPAIFTANYSAVESWTSREHYGLNHAASGSHKPGQCAVVCTNTSAAIDALADVPCAFAFATDIYNFGYNTGAAWVIVGGSIAAGTKMLFYQDTAPVGWTINTNVNDTLVYVSKGSAASGETGGSACSSGSWTISGFETNVGGTTLTIAQMPSHTHTFSYLTYWDYTEIPLYTTHYDPTGSGVTVTTSAAGGGQAHTHAMASHDATWRPSSYCVIVGTKD